MLLFVGDPHDLTGVYVKWLAERRGVETALLAESRFGIDWWFNLDEDAGTAELVHDGTLVEGARIQGAFVRFNPEPALPEGWKLSEPATELFVQERRAAISEALESLGVRVVNPPSAGRSNGAKPLHMAKLARHGFEIPDWLVVNDPAAVDRFLGACPEGAVVKASSGLRSHVRLADADFLARVAEGTTPAVLQRFVPGHEVRVHVVGQSVFGARIDSSDVDYRFSGEHVRYREEEVPDDIAQRCIDAAAREGLVLAGLDFRVDPAGRWWCLEMNPVPTFLPYEASTGLAIGDAIVNHLLDSHKYRSGRSPLAELVQTELPDPAP